MEEILPLHQACQAMLLHIKPKQLAPFTKECVCLRLYILLKHFVVQEGMYSKGLFWIPGFHAEPHKANHPFLLGLSQTPIRVNENSSIDFHMSKYIREYPSQKSL